MSKILIVEDDRMIAESVKNHLETWGYEAVIAEHFQNVLEDVTASAPDLILLDITLPSYNGFYWCREIRKVSRVPIVFVSSAAENMNIVMAMNMGADDYIAKPFDGDVLIAKIQALLRRTYDFGESNPVLEHRGAMLNTGDGSFYYGDQLIPLSKNEYRILAVLMKQKGKVVSREKLMEALWQTDEFVDENALTVNVGRLRKKLEKAGLEQFIETKFGMGYVIPEA